MAGIEVSDKEFIDFPCNFGVYFGFLKKYERRCFFLAGLNPGFSPSFYSGIE